MKTEKNFEQTIKAALESECENIAASAKLKARIDEQIRMRQEEKFMAGISMKKLAAGVAAACLLVSGSVFAGHVAGVIKSGSSRPEYTSYEQMGQAEKKLGYSVDHVEDFDNGYHFAGAGITNISTRDDNGNTLYNAKGIDIEYQKAGEAEITLSVEEVRSDAWKEYTPASVRTCGDITLQYNVLTNKFVPADYVLTEEDKANMEKDDYNLAYGSDSVQINQSMHVRWEKDGILYHLFGFDVSLSADEMFDMAETIINAE